LRTSFTSVKLLASVNSGLAFVFDPRVVGLALLAHVVRAIVADDFAPRQLHASSLALTDHLLLTYNDNKQTCYSCSNRSKHVCLRSSFVLFEKPFSFSREREMNG